MGKEKIKYIFLVCLSTFLFSQNMLDRLRVPISFSVTSAMGYDDNYLKLSTAEMYEAQFFSEILGDSNQSSTLINRNSFSIIYKPYVINKHVTKFKFSIRNTKYFQANYNSYYSLTLNISQHLGKYEWIKLSYSYMPNYFIRDFRDRDNVILNLYSNTILQNCSFGQNRLSASYSKHLINRSWFEGVFSYQSQYYNPSFTEFDLNIYSYGLKISIREFKKYPIEIKWNKSFADNLQSNKEYLSSYNLDRGYIQDFISFKIERNKIYSDIFYAVGFSYSLALRKFSSIFESDILHNKRSHNEIRFRYWIKGKINRSLKFQIDFQNRSRSTTSNYLWVEELKSFNKIDYNIKFSYNFISSILY